MASRKVAKRPRIRKDQRTLAAEKERRLAGCVLRDLERMAKKAKDWREAKRGFAPAMKQLKRFVRDGERELRRGHWISASMFFRIARNSGLVWIVTYGGNPKLAETFNAEVCALIPWLPLPDPFKDKSRKEQDALIMLYALDKSTPAESRALVLESLKRPGRTAGARHVAAYGLELSLCGKTWREAGSLLLPPVKGVDTRGNIVCREAKFLLGVLKRHDLPHE